MATRQSRPDSGLGFQVQVLTISQVDLISLGDLARQRSHRGERMGPIRAKVDEFVQRTQNVDLKIVRLGAWGLTRSQSENNDFTEMCSVPKRARIQGSWTLCITQL